MFSCKGLEMHSMMEWSHLFYIWSSPLPPSLHYCFFFHLYVTLVYLLCIHPPFPLPPPNCLMSYSHHLFTLFFSHVKFVCALFLSLICQKLPWPCLSVSFHNVTVQCTIKAPLQCHTSWTHIHSFFHLD